MDTRAQLSIRVYKEGQLKQETLKVSPGGWAQLVNLSRQWPAHANDLGWERAWRKEAGVASEEWVKE